jgi:gliding motility-associated-like protein
VYISCDPNEFCDISEIKVPNGLTPNGDNINDILKIVKPASCRSIDISIYNRWGQAVWAKSDYENDWDGRSINGNPLPDGTYYLILSLPSPGTDIRSFKTFIDIRSR